jgi:hypothetical protein
VTLDEALNLGAGDAVIIAEPRKKPLTVVLGRPPSFNGIALYVSGTRVNRDGRPDRRSRRPDQVYAVNEGWVSRA